MAAAAVVRVFEPEEVILPLPQRPGESRLAIVLPSTLSAVPGNCSGYVLECHLAPLDDPLKQPPPFLSRWAISRDVIAPLVELGLLGPLLLIRPMCFGDRGRAN